MEKFCTICGKELVDGKCPCCEKGTDKKSDSTNNEKKFSNNGVINRVAIKNEAKRLIENNLWTIWKPSLIVSLISGILGALITALFGEGTDAGTIISAIANVFLLPMSIGLVQYVLNFVRGKSYDINDLFSFYDKRFLLIFLTSFLVGLFTTLWSLLLIIPGIIAALSYSMITYLLADGKKNDAMEVIKESKRMMNGYKMDYFVFGLSFIGWALLCTLIIPIIYVMPYITVSNALYYEELRKIKK